MKSTLSRNIWPFIRKVMVITTPQSQYDRHIVLGGEALARIVLDLACAQ